MIDNKDKIIIKKFFEAKYPQCTHELGLDICFDYYSAVCFNILKKNCYLNMSIEPIPTELKNKIQRYISENEKNSNSLELKKYYELLQSTINILQNIKIRNNEKER